ncbi:MAG: tRNA (adenosine(37)-N6)-threonylcarbamoyltransferase complex ATPase subunit type 1 TsaE [Myxococcota bacterium]|nr:tRNA (adenosine(37)-N6)-threonylcarbamoyltransferase complex ATPase subunit type 1 TsaE [Myxococcota bacterium]
MTTENPEVWVERVESLEDTLHFGKRLGQIMKPGDVIALVGDLGAGKTQLVHGIAAGLRILPTEQVTSPTYAYVNEYRCEENLLLHYDLYRLTDAESAYGLGLADHPSAEHAINVFEWADRVPEIISDEAIWIYIKIQDEGRDFEIHGLHRSKL